MAATAREMVELIQAALEANPLVAEITVDGQRIRYERAQALKELEYWRRRAATRSLFRSFDMSGRSGCS